MHQIVLACFLTPWYCRTHFTCQIMDVIIIMEWSTNDNHPSSTAYSSNIVNQYTAMSGARLKSGYDYMGAESSRRCARATCL